jgi:EAL domain-containing protein (putative c-di-GMP-specific phosphodiesterase class I)
VRDSSYRAPLTREQILRLIEEPGHIALVGQPIVETRRGRVGGYELLARFSLEQPVAPDQVFAEATRHGLADRLEGAVIETALGLVGTQPRNCFVTINVDPRQIRSRVVLDALDRPSSLSGIVLELTEHGEPDDLDAMREVLEHVRARGANTAIDDAGAGYSGLKQILELRPQYLKIDRDLVSGLHQNEAKRALVQMLGELAGRLDAWVIAEGIEHEAELVVLQQLGVPLTQGWFLSRPAPPWCEVRSEALDVLGARESIPMVGRRIGAEAEPCPLIGEEGWEHAPIAVGLDGEGRPRTLRLRTLHGVVERAPHETLIIRRDTSLGDAAWRAAARAERVRWEPLVCVDDRGAFLGVVAMERLVCALASAGEPERLPLRRLTQRPPP